MSKIATSQVYKVIYKHLQDCTYIKELDDVQRTNGKPQNMQWKCNHHIKKSCTGISGKRSNLYLEVKSKWD